MNYKLKKVMITGSKGYIGSVICPQLEKLNYNILGIDNNYFSDCLIDNKTNDPATINKHLNEITIEDLNGIDAVIHLSGLQNDPLKNTYPGKVYDIEYCYTKQLAEFCKRLNIKFIYASSCSIYGTGSKDLVNEDSPVNPITPYSKNKLRTELFLISISNDSFNPIILRFSTVYGFSPRMRFDLYINMFVGMALTDKKIQLNSDGLAWRPNLYIGDIHKVLDAALKYDFKETQLINIGNNNSNAQVVDVIKIIKNICGDLDISFLKPKSDSLYSDQYISGDKDLRSYRVDFSKMNETFKDNLCHNDLPNGIGSLVNDLKKFKDLDSKIKDKKFFRLQWVKYLIDKKIINKNFYYRN